MKRDDLILLFCIIILIMVGGRLAFQSSNTDCNKCTVTFNDKQSFETEINEKFEVKIIDLFNAYVEDGDCLVYWDPVQGYGGGYGNIK